MEFYSGIRFEGHRESPVGSADGEIRSIFAKFGPQQSHYGEMGVSRRTRRKVGDFGNDAWHTVLLWVGEMSGVTSCYF